MREKLHVFYQISEMLHIIQMVKLNKLEGFLSPAKMILHYSDNARYVTYESPRWLLMRKSACVQSFRKLWFDQPGFRSKHVIMFFQSVCVSSFVGTILITLKHCLFWHRLKLQQDKVRSSLEHVHK